MTILISDPLIFRRIKALLVLLAMILTAALPGQDIPCSCQTEPSREPAMYAGDQSHVHSHVQHRILPGSGNVFNNSQAGDNRLELMVFEGWDHKYKRWNYFLKEEIKYDEHGRMVSWTDYTWNKSDSHWNSPRNKAEIAYDELGNMSYHVRRDSYYDSISYYPDGLMKSRQTDDYELSCSWLCIKFWHRTESTYNKNGRLTTVVNYDRDNSSGTWIPRDKSEYEYDSLNGISTRVAYTWVHPTGVWMPTELDSSFCTPAGKTDRIDIYHWNDNLGRWTYSMAEQYTYDHNDSIILWTRGDEREEYTYDPEGNLTLWIREGDVRIEHTYDDSGNKISTSWYIGQDNDWVFYDREDYEYDPWGHMIVWTDYDGSGHLNIRNLYYYDHSWARRDLVLPPLDYLFFNPDLEEGYGIPCYFNCPTDYPVHMLTGYMKYAYVDGEWWFLTRGTLYYSVEPTAVPDYPVQGLKVYPNPASDYLTFELDHAPAGMTIDVYDIHGRLVLNLTEYGPVVRVPAQHLGTGIYLYRVISGGELFSGRFLIQ